jgi:Cleavage site for pathogenic type III effector avirulence factor Avr
VQNRNRSNIPKFGEWKDGGASMPYTVVFDKARMKKTDPNFNPNDPIHFQELVKEKPAIPKPNAPQPRQMKGGAGERREERRYPPSTPSQAHEHVRSFCLCC